MADGGSAAASVLLPQTNRVNVAQNSNEGEFTDDLSERIADWFVIEAESKLGEGCYGVVTKGISKTTQAVRAVKTTKKTSMKGHFRQEIAIMRKLDHPNIVKLYSEFEDQANIYLVLELCSGGDLYDRVISMGHLKERQVAVLMRDLFRAVQHMHENKICHRDLKPEHFLLTSQDPIGHASLKVIDFGLACIFQDDVPIKTKAGTPYFVAPQVLAGKYDKACDLWSLGVVMYLLLCGYPPFAGDTDSAVFAKVRHGKVEFAPVDWMNISKEAMALVESLLKMNDKERCTAQQALTHEWIAKAVRDAEDGVIGADSMRVDRLKEFQSTLNLNKELTDKVVTLAPYFKIKDLDKFKNIWRENYSKFAHKELVWTKPLF
jgi:calcium-dependent protein kinase